MIKTYDFLYKRYLDYAAKYQLQVDTEDSFNGKLAEVQIEALNLLLPFYSSNEKVRNLIAVWVKKVIGSSDATGQVTQPTEFDNVISMGVVDASNKLLFPIFKSQENEIILAQQIPQRKPDVTKQRVYYINYGDIIQLYPEQVIKYVLFYFIYPSEAKVAFTYAMVGGEYVQTLDTANTVDLAWDKSAANLLLYMLLEKYGISSRDDLIAEFGKFGVSLTLNSTAS